MLVVDEYYLLCFGLFLLLCLLIWFFKPFEVITEICNFFITKATSLWSWSIESSIPAYNLLDQFVMFRSLFSLLSAISLSMIQFGEWQYEACKQKIEQFQKEEEEEEGKKKEPSFWITGLLSSFSLFLYYLLILPAPIIDIPAFFAAQQAKLDKEKEEEEEKEKAKKEAEREQPNSLISRLYYSAHPHLLVPSRPPAQPRYPLNLPLKKEDEPLGEGKAPLVFPPLEDSNKVNELFSRSFKKLEIE
eukprot:Phypoly_transcript_06355.p1 GENE.Phypoly_transcript_06355~~Phypoly_transcript_06355.p1  ORF type:complete len:246 (+),score=66.67 Phypoly_transcript_06355:103-840(+)